MMREKEIEAHLREAVKAAGGLALKFVSPGFDGVPDRILLFPGGKITFAETKKPGGKPAKRQKVVHRILLRLGFRIYVPDNISDVDKMI